MAVSNGSNDSWQTKPKENLDKAFELVHTVESSYLNEPDKMVGLLKTASQFYQYSVNNLKLIYAQNPNAMYVQSFEAWKKDGFHVLRGQKGMKIFVPVRTTLLKLENGEVVSLSEASAEQKEQYKNGTLKSFTKTNYKIGNVFDITQTNFPMERYPELVKVNNSKDFSAIRQMYSASGTLEGICKSILLSHSMGESISKEQIELLRKSVSSYISENEGECSKKIDEALRVAIKDYKDLMDGQVVTQIPHDDTEEIKINGVSENNTQAKSKKKLTVAERNYNAMMELAADVLKGEAESAYFDAGEHYDKLSIVGGRGNVVSMAHTYVQNGDLMYDPYMEFIVDHENKTLNAYYYEISSMCYNDCAIREDNSINETVQRDMNKFVRTWFKNIKYQGYKRVIENENTEEVTETTENNILVPKFEYEEKCDLVVGDIIEFEDKLWKITQNSDNFMVSGDNLDPTDRNSSFSWIGNINNHDYKIIKKTLVALESTEDYSDHAKDFYTYHYQDGREGIRYRLVMIGEDGYLKPYKEEASFFITKELAEEYIAAHAAFLEVIPYDDIVYRAGYEIAKTQLQTQISEPATESSYYFEVAECSEFHTMGKIYSEIKTAADAIIQYNDIEEAKRTLGPGINLIVENGDEKEEIPLSSGRNIDLEMFKYYPQIESDDKVKSIIRDFVNEAKRNGFQTFGSYQLENSAQMNNGVRHRRGR